MSQPSSTRSRCARAAAVATRPPASFLVVLLALLCAATAAFAAPPRALERIDVPANVLVSAGDVEAYRAVGPDGDEWTAQLSLDSLHASAGEFRTVVVQQIPREGSVSVFELEAPPCGSPLEMQVRTGDTYVLFAQITGLARNNYDVLCQIDGVLPNRVNLIPRICTLIYCSDEIFPAGELGERLHADIEVRDPDLPIGWPEGPGGPWPPGGLGGGNLCDQCLHQEPEQTVIGVPGCSRIPGEEVPEPQITDGDVVYVHQEWMDGIGPANMQIYRMKASGSSPVNLSNNGHYETFPDVHHDDGQIVFNSSRPGPDRIYVMNADGSGQREVSGTELASRPRWSPANLIGSRFIVFTVFEDGRRSIWTIRPDGSNKRQLTFPASYESDAWVDVVNSKYLIVSRFDRETGQADLYRQYIPTPQAPDKLTSTPSLIETLPVVSRDGSLLAYAVRDRVSGSEWVEVVEIVSSSLISYRTITLDLPASRGISGLDFWPGDDGLFVSIEANDVPATIYHQTQEVFAVDFDGAQWRLTNNDSLDKYPSAAP